MTNYTKRIYNWKKCSPDYLFIKKILFVSVEIEGDEDDLMENKKLEDYLFVFSGELSSKSVIAI